MVFSTMEGGRSEQGYEDGELHKARGLQRMALAAYIARDYTSRETSI